jgi:hypothetical protein
MATTTQLVPFRLILMPCCGTLLCCVNPRFYNYCPECGKFVASTIKEGVRFSDDAAILKTKEY